MPLELNFVFEHSLDMYLPVRGEGVNVPAQGRFMRSFRNHLLRSTHLA